MIDLKMTTDSNARPNMPRISHELRTPMNHIIGYSELLIEDADDQGLETLAEYLRHVRALGKELLAALNDTFSTLHAEPQVVRLRQAHPQLTAQAEQIGEAVLESQAQAREQGHEAFLPDLQKIETAVRNFLAMVEQFTASDTG